MVFCLSRLLFSGSKGHRNLHGLLIRFPVRGPRSRGSSPRAIPAHTAGVETHQSTEPPAARPEKRTKTARRGRATWFARRRGPISRDRWKCTRFSRFELRFARDRENDSPLSTPSAQKRSTSPVRIRLSADQRRWDGSQSPRSNRTRRFTAKFAKSAKEIDKPDHGSPAIRARSAWSSP
jgi:hypothetical protein